MRKTMKTIVTAMAVLAVFAGGSALFAYADTPASEMPSDMMQSGQGDMMGMMQQMSEMMTTCNDMMQGMAHHGTETQENETSPLDSEG